MSKNRVIGVNGKLPWHLPADLKRFRELTTGHHIIMGRKTFESLPKGPLPNRTNIVVTRQKKFEASGCVIAHSISEAVEKAKGDAETFIIGGAEIYKAALPMAHRIYLTLVDQTIDGDAFFPEFSNDEWTLVKEDKHPPDEKNKLAVVHRVYERGRP